MVRIFYLLALTGIIALTACSTTKKTSQSEGPVGMKQKQFNNEQIEADALALADITCQWELAKYYSDLQEHNNKLKSEEKNLRKMKSAFEEKMKIRYMQIDNLKKKFNKELEKAHKRLDACGKLDVIREMQKELEMKKQEGEQ